MGSGAPRTLHLEPHATTIRDTRAMSSNPADPFDLERFVNAQAKDYEQALVELRAGFKQSHWIWYVLPQLRGLGMSRLSEFYGIANLAEARAYLEHKVLGARLVECVEVINALHGVDAEQLLGEIDAMKFRSCLTLFARVASEPAQFLRALSRYYAGRPDERTLELLRA
jgi:uncharacterized protein (DUF1810 family)